MAVLNRYRITIVRKYDVIALDDQDAVDVFESEEGELVYEDIEEVEFIEGNVDE